MDMDQSAVFLAGTILFALGLIVLIGAFVVINNILHKYWKPVQFFKWADHPATRFMTQEEAARIAPHLEEATNGKSQEKRNA
jgi:hypothetical protein